MRILICDDEPLIMEQLKSYIESYFKHSPAKCPEIVCFSDGKSLLADTGAKDIVFLDIEMPGMNGIYIGNELKKQYPNSIIFVITSYLEYLDEAMRFRVFRYLSKPLEKQRLFRNLKDALEAYNSFHITLPIETRECVYTIPTSDIVLVEAQEKRILVRTLASNYLSVHNIQYWLNVLPQNNFYQTHRSFIINLDYVSDFDHTLVHLADKQFTAYLTRRKYTAFKEAYLLYIESTR